MTSDERAAQLWSLLVLAARNQQILSYSMLEHLTGLPRQSMGPRLAPIQDYCIKNKLPPLTSIAVTEADGVPGDKFVGAKIEDIFSAQARVFVFDWFSQKIPFPLKPED
jgi:putative restriction endonuclease